MRITGGRIQAGRRPAAARVAVSGASCVPGARTAVVKPVLVAAAVGLLAASAWLSVPFYPVPLTMQTLAVLLVGGLLGPRLGVSAVAGYLMLGAAGAPVFHGGLGGFLVLAGPTGGYLVGFLPAALVMGLAGQSLGRGRAGGGARRRVLFLACGVIMAEIAIYALGVPWLALFTGSSLRTAVDVGLLPFVLGDLLKAAVAVGALSAGAAALSRRGSLLP